MITRHYNCRRLCLLVALLIITNANGLARRGSFSANGALKLKKSNSDASSRKSKLKKSNSMSSKASYHSKSKTAPKMAKKKASVSSIPAKSRTSAAKGNVTMFDSLDSSFEDEATVEADDSPSMEDEPMIEKEVEDSPSSKKKGKKKGKSMADSTPVVAPAPMPSPGTAISGDEVFPDVEEDVSSVDLDLVMEEDSPSEDLDQSTTEPSEEATEAPTDSPVTVKTEAPTIVATDESTMAPSLEPTIAPTVPEAKLPTIAPIVPETEEPSVASDVPETEEPTTALVVPETEEPTISPVLPETEEPTAAPVLPGTEVPTSVEEGDNDTCRVATQILFGETVSGSTVGATMDDTTEDCGTARGGPQSAPGRWYVVEGTGDEMQMYANATYDIQFAVYGGDDCASLTCLGGTEGLPPDYDFGFVIFPSVASERYYIRVDGYDGAVGAFEFVVSNVQQVLNDECLDATELTVGEVVSGSTIFAMADEIEDFCTGWDFEEKGVWYLISGSGGKLQASATNTSYAAQISIYTGPCEAETCVTGTIAPESMDLSPVVWDSQENEVYLILISGINGQVGTFDLEITETTAPTNNNCSDAIELSVTASTNGTTVGANLDSVTYCGLANAAVAPGVWFSVVANGKTLRATVFAEYDSQINVYAGDTCDALICINGNDEATTFSEGSSELAWDTTEGERYFILVHGFNQQVGNFQLDVTTVERPTNDGCTGAIELEIGDTLAASTALATDDGMETCGNALGGNLSAPGVWYSLSQEVGSTLTAEVISTYDIQISVYTGSNCEALICVDGTEGDRPAFTSGNVAWDPVEGETYWIFVHGYSQQVGDFELSIVETSRPDNDRCEDAAEIGSNSLVNGTTSFATTDDIESCGTVVGGNLSAPGVWYVMDGTGSAISVSVESDDNVQLSLYSGNACDDLRCEVGRPGDDPFLNTATEIIDSVQGLKYYIFVNGLSRDIGQFSVQTAQVSRPDNDQCFTATEIGPDADVTGATVYASAENVTALCGGTNPDSAAGVWYLLRGSGDRLTASFNADYDAQLTIFEGSDCEELSCIDGTDGDGPDYLSGSVSWDTEAGTMYYLFVHGFNRQVGVFDLAISGSDREVITPENVICNDAINVQPNGEIIRGSTVSAVRDESLTNCSWASGYNTTGGLWYSLRGTGSLTQIRVLASFDSQLSLYTGESCEDLTCVDGNNESPVYTASSLLLAETAVDQMYYILVHGVAPSRGEFALSVAEVTLPENDGCDAALPLEVGDVVTGSTLTASTTGGVAFSECGDSVGGDSSAPGLYYTIVGTGQVLNAAVNANFEIQLTIWEGNDCDALECVDGTDGVVPNYTSGSITWEALAGVNYVILVHGFVGEVGEFELSIDSVNRPPNDQCSTAIQIPADLVIGGSTAFAGIDIMTGCIGDEPMGGSMSPGVWYTYSPTSAGDVTLTMTNTTFVSYVSILSGDRCDSLSCIAGDALEADLEGITWYSEEDDELYIFINGFDGNQGEFEFVISQA